MKKVVNIKVEKEKWISAQDEAFKKLNKKAQVDGFRPGKAPRSMYEKKYGKFDIIYEAADQIINEEYENALKQSGIIPEMQPVVDLVKCDEEELEINYTFIAVSEVKLGEYKNLGIKKESARVTKKEVEKEINHLLNNFTEIVEKDGVIATGDIAIIDFEGFKDSVAFDGGKGTNYQLEIGSHTFIPGFEEGLIGMACGEEKELELTFPKDYASEELKGQKVIFKVKVNEVKERRVPELDEEFFADLAMPEINSKEDLEKAITKELKEHKQQHIEEEYISKVVDKAIENMTIDIEEELIDQEADIIYNDFKEKLNSKGLEEDIYFQYAKISKEDYLKEMKKEAKKRISYRHLVNEIIKQEKITVSDEDVEAKINEYMEKYNLSREEVLEEVDGIETLKFDIMLNKVLEVIKSN